MHRQHSLILAAYNTQILFNPTKRNDFVCRRVDASQCEAKKFSFPSVRAKLLNLISYFPYVFQSTREAPIFLPSNFFPMARKRLDIACESCCLRKYLYLRIILIR